MSDIRDCASQEIEASTSSNSTRNSKKFSFIQSILNTDNSQNLRSDVPQIFIGKEEVPELPMLEKNDFIKNWIIAHSNIVDSPEKSSPGSPILGISSAKRSPQSPILGYQWKRIKREAGSKENCRVSLNKKFQQTRPDPMVTARITIEHENPRYSQPEIFLSSHNDSHKTLKSAKSPVLNRITNSPILNTRTSSFEQTKSPTKFDADSTLKWNDRKSIVRDNAKITESLSLSSPLCERNNPFKIVDDSNYPKKSVEALNKQLLQFSELLVEESPFDVEVISSSSKIPETLSHSTIGAECVELKANSKKSYPGNDDFQANEDINKFERLHRRSSSSNSIKFEAETSSNHDRFSQGHESSNNSSVRLSIPSPYRNKKLIRVESYNASCIRPKTSPLNVETVETLQGFDHLKKIQESSSIPDTLSVSSQLRESLVPDSVIYLDRLSIPSPLRNNKTIASSLVKTVVPESSDSPDRSSISSPLRRKKLIDLKSTNTSWIRAKHSCIKSEALETLQELGQSIQSRESLQIPETLSVSSQLDESLIPESINKLDRLLIPSPLRNKKVIVSSSLFKTVVPESSDSPDRSSISSPLRRKKLIDLKSTNTSWTKAKNSCLKSETLETLQEVGQSKKSRESLQIPETLSVSSRLDESLIPESMNKLDRLLIPSPLRNKKVIVSSPLFKNVVPESSDSPDRSSISSPLRRKKLIDLKSTNTSWTRAKNSCVKSEALETSQELGQSIKSRESLQISETLSVSSQLDESLIPESINNLDPLLIPSPLRNKKVIVSSSLVKNVVPESSDSPDRSSISSPLRRKNFIDLKSTNTSWIRGKNSCIKSEVLGTSQRLVQSKKSRESLQISETLSVSSQLDESLIPESINNLDRLLIPSPLRNKKVIVSSSLFKNVVPKSSDSSDRLTISSPLRRKKPIDIKSTNTSWIRAKNSCIKSEVLGTSQRLVQSKKSRETLQIPDTLSVSSQLDEIQVPESSNSPNQSSLSSSLAKNVHKGIKSVNTPWIRIKDEPMKFEAVASPECIKRLIEIRESSKISNTLSERIDVESNTTNAPEDDIKIDSDSEGTISDFIENVATQNNAAIGNKNFSEPPKSKLCRNKSCDSDETYYSDGDSIPRLQIIKASPLKNSQQISQSTSQSNEGRVSANRSDINISQAASPLKNNSCQPTTNVISLHTKNNNNKKKKKGKKGSLVAKLQSIVNSQVSNLRIWRYQMSQPDFKKACTQFVKLKIRERETRYGRHYLTASVIEDSHNLLKSLFESDSNLPNEKSGGSFEISIITLVMIPEIIGIVKIRPKSILKIYPPWEIMDPGRKILNVMFFNIGAPEEENFDNEDVIKRGNKNIIEDFECPCIRTKTLVDSCRVKFSNTKPSVMESMFNF